MPRKPSLLRAIVRSHAAYQRNVRASERRAAQAQRAADQEAAREEREEQAEARRIAQEAKRQQRETELAAKSAEKAEQARRKQAEADELEAMARQAESDTAALQERINELTALLSHTLGVDDHIAFADLRPTETPPTLHLPELVLPDLEIPPELDVAPPEPLADRLARIRPLNLAERMLRSGRIKKQEIAAANAFRSDQAAYDAIAARRRQLEADHARRVEDARTRHHAECVACTSEHALATEHHEQVTAARNAELDELERGYAAGESEAVSTYNEMVLEASAYPEGFPQRFRVAYQADAKQLVIDYELPAPAIVPDVAGYRFIKTRRTTESKPRKPAEISAVYRQIVAQLALRTIHEVFEADRAGHLTLVVFSGFVHRIDPATGNDTTPYLLSVRVDRETFLQLNLERIDPTECLRNLGAQVSPRPEEAQPVKPVVEFDMVDPRFVAETDMLGTLEGRPNLMDLTPSEFEALVSNLFNAMGLESKLTRSSRDGGVDAVAFDPRPILGGKVVIQAKRYRNTVGVSAVRDLWGTCLNEGASKGILVTTSSYGPDAYGFANGKPLELIDGGGLLYLLLDAGMPARIVMPIE